MRFRTPILLTALIAVLVPPTGAPAAADRLQPGARVWLHAHNCYPEKGQWGDRIQRALAVRTSDIAIEQDVAWFVDPSTGRGRIVVSHDAKPDGTEPTLEAHFFDRVRPIVEAALRDNRKDTWPVMVLHLDFKTNEPAHHQAVWDLLGKYESWLTTAERVAEEQRVTPFTPGPILGTHRGRPEPGRHLLHTRSGRRQAAALWHHPAGDVPGGHHRRGARGRRSLGAAGRAHPHRRDQLPALDQFLLGGRRARRADQGRSVDQRRQPAAARDRGAGPRDGPVGAVLHAQRPPGCREQGLDGELQLRFARRRPRSHGRRAGCGSRVHRHRPVPGARRRAAGRRATFRNAGLSRATCYLATVLRARRATSCVRRARARCTYQVSRIRCTWPAPHGARSSLTCT